MPNEPRNKTGRTLRQQLKAAADATAAQQAASKRGREIDDVSSDSSARASRRSRSASAPKREGSAKEASGHGERLTKRRATHEQVAKERKLERDANKSEEGFHPLKAALELFGNMGLGYRIVVGVVAFLLVVGAVLYPISCTYYQAMRQQQQLEAVLAAVNERNEQIDNENKQLETNEGVENQAREEYGWVKDGEHATVVTNGRDGSENDKPSQVDETKIEPPHTWYYDILDVVFQSKV